MVARGCSGAHPQRRGPVLSGHWALVASAHGFGHTARLMELGAALRARGDQVTLFSHAPTTFLAEAPLRHVSLRVDVGLVQPDSIREDLAATEHALDALLTAPHLDRLADVLSPFDVVVADIAPPVLEAARRAGVPAVALGNFDWAWVYRQLGLDHWAERFSAWQAPHPAVFLPPGPGLFGFSTVRTGGLLARSLPPAAPLALEEGERAVLVSFGGLGLDALERLLPRLLGVRWVLGPPLAPLNRDDVLFVRAPYPALLHRVHAVLTKPGYGVYGETARVGVPVAWLPRPGFPETPSLAAALAARGDVEIAEGPAHPNASEAIAAAVARALAQGRRRPHHGGTQTTLAALDAMLTRHA